MHEKQIEIIEEFQDLGKKVLKISQEISQLNKEIEEYKKGGFSDGSFLNISMRNDQLGEKYQKASGLISAANYQFFEVEKKEFDFYLQDLVSKCLMQDTRGHGLSSISNDYVITEFGIAYLEFLKL